jgi:membrane protein implicated in regulation of membrane protease activity
LVLVDAWVIWIVLACLLGVGEIATVSFFLGPFAAGAVAAAIVALAGGGWIGSAAAFLVISVLLLLFVRPIAKRHLRQGPLLRTGTAALLGRSAIVLERIANDEGSGAARIDGEVWTARAFDEDRIIEAGEKVSVIEIRGATALVD